jgi:hypothetical protein
MTEAEWLASTDPTPMLEFLRGRVSDRKLRLFSVACCRRIWHLLSDEGRRVIELAEQSADGLTTSDELPVPWPLHLYPADTGLTDWATVKATGSARAASQMAGAKVMGSTGPERLAWHATRHAAAAVAWKNAGVAKGATQAAAWAATWGAVEAGEFKQQALLLRDLVTPFHRVAIAPAWLTQLSDDSYSEVSTESWGSRLAKSVAGALLFLGSFPLLWQRRADGGTELFLHIH